MARVIALIPARGGSKGIPGKNLQRVGGRPLIVRTIAQARSTAQIDCVYVSTDDPEIARVSRRAGAKVIERPETLASDTASTESSVRHALDVLAEQDDSPEVVVLLQCTSPFRHPGQLDRALARFARSSCDSMLSAVPFHGFVWTASEEHEGHEPVNYDPASRPRRQEIQDMYRETGSFYIFTRELFDRTGVRLGGKMEVFEVPSVDAIDIDHYEDLAAARMQVGRMGDPDIDDAPGLKWLVLDVDGTLTDGAMFYGEDGSEYKRFDTRDGMGIRLWKESGGRVALITGENSQAAKRRAEKLRADHVVLGCQDKRTALAQLKEQYGLEDDEVVAMGDDLNDLPMVDGVRLFVAPATARPEVLERADLVTEAAGGHGAVRELVDLLLRCRGVARAA